MTAKEKKAEYDRKRRELKKDELRLKKKAYNESPRGREIQKRQREKRKQYHNEYCRSKDQRYKERIRNRIKNGLTETKFCLLCGDEKEKIYFESYKIFSDGRHYMCKECEYKNTQYLGITTRFVLQCIRSILIKTKSILKVSDIAKYPYFIESYKYLLLLKQLTK